MSHLAAQMDSDGLRWTIGEELEVRRPLSRLTPAPQLLRCCAASPDAGTRARLGHGAAGSGDTPYQAPTYPPGSAAAILAYAGPSTLIVDSPEPARTTMMSAGSAEGLLSRCTAPLET
jgi:hypothetical protein